MLSLGEKIRALMANQGKTIEDLEKDTGLSNMQIMNIIRNRSKRTEYVSKIAKSLGTDFATLIELSNNFSIQLKEYIQAIEIVNQSLLDRKISTVDSVILLDCYEKSYKHLIENKNKRDTELYIKGMIDGHIGGSNISRTT